MILRLLLLLVISHTSLQLDATISYWDEGLVRPYVHHSDLQRRWAMSFLAPHLTSLRGNEAILDIGCGDGKITADVSKFVSEGVVVGIDPSTSMINWAQKQYHRNEYPNLTFQEGSFLEPISGEFDLIISFCALQHCSDQEAALKNIHRALKADGKLLILVPLMNNPAWNQARSTVQNYPEWQDYWKGFPPRKFLTLEQYMPILAECGLNAKSVEAVNTMDPFVSKEEIIDWLEGTFPPVIPKESARKFYAQWIEEYLKLDPCAVSNEGVIYAKLGYIGIVSTKVWIDY